MGLKLDQKRQKQAIIFSTLLLLVGIVTVIGVQRQQDSSAQTPTVRNKYLWPFAASSPWNMPVGSSAQYTHAGLSPALAHSNDIVTTDKIHISVDKTDPIKLLNSAYKVHVDPTLAHNGSWNGIGVLLREGGNTVAEGQTLYLSAGGNPTWEHKYGYDNDLKGNGIRGAHGGSAMSGLGGTIRDHEWHSTDPIRHALAINLFGVRFLSTANNGYRWPATKADRGYDVYDTTVPTNYYGRTGKGYDFMGMGTLLALKPTYDVSTITDPKARRIAQALKDYGGYVVDNTAWDVHALSVEHGVNSDFRNAGPAFHSQLMGVFSNLHAITNNSATSVGGGGTPRVPLAPCFDDDTTCTTSTTPPPPAPATRISQSGNIAASTSFVSSIGDASPTYAASKVNDTDETTRWISPVQDNAALTTDLGSIHTLSKVSVLWAGNTTKSYDLQMSDDNIAWKTIASGATNNTSEQLIDTSTFTSAATGRYFRILAKDRWNATFGNSIYEIGIYGSASTAPVNLINQNGNLLTGKAFTASTSSVSGYPLTNLNNSNETDRWISAAADNVSLTTDLGATFSLNKVSVLWAANTTQNYDIQVSGDNLSWKTVASGTTNNATRQLIDTTTFLSPATGRYLRIVMKDRWNVTFGNSIFEIGAYGAAVVTPPALPGDANGDNRVNAIDLSVLLSKDGTTYAPADFNKDGIVGAADMAILLGKWTW